MTFTLPPRPSKPRETGITSIIDFGPDTFGWTGPRGVKDLLDCAADHIDYAKIYALNSLLMPADTLREIVALYRDAGVLPYAGGIYLEYALQEDEVDEALAHLKTLGLDRMELSENYVELTDEQRTRLLDKLQGAGFEVIYEFGRKNPEEPLPIDELEEIVLGMLDRDIHHIIFEQSEFDAMEAANPKAVDDLRQRNWFKQLLIEGDPYRFPKQHADLIQRFGPEVNLANIPPGHALRIAQFRYGIGRAVNYSIIHARSI
ncbi:MAG: phosphosulfolactate synthase [Acetobacterales bacterium]